MGATVPAAQNTSSPPQGGDNSAVAPAIEANAPDEEQEEDEFEPSDLDGVSTESTSISSSIFQHHFENGRRYHQYKNGRYPIPNDDAEQNREDMKHAMHLELTNGKLFFAPIGDSPRKIIDLGTGTGVWVLDVADQFPSAEVIGTDLSPIQSTWVPPNVRFLVDDFEDEWLNGDDFDLVHLRNIAPIAKDMAKVIRQSLEHTRPGGWIEIQEFGGEVLSDDNTLGDSTLPQFMEKTGEALAKFGMDSKIANEKIGKLLEEAGYTNISLKTIKVPVGIWAKDKTLRLVGMYMKTNLEGFVGIMASKPLLALGLSRVEAELLAANARKDMTNPLIHAYINYRCWMGQKWEGEK